tara:strand:- start:9983 stop:10198 length:216 start_codon:yes stop_codon:yes gene_type:complete
MGPLSAIQDIEMRAAAADDARRTSRAIRTDPTPGYLADVCNALADAEAFCRRASDKPAAPRDPLMEFRTQW